ncbi:hypothetical protein L861_04860 [Litchfieldella anticariensis FP35 = DSM 16096]|uniref:Nucleoside-binding outer membrane protein n=1 Tax=Litchfieldella anticariensis (strain DSM 16096 / CECT 5854 / CIP 108499 / LMG 22089 / FP35) TaxID=1121939 RepID=S2L2X8_LITA3|nr:hypothetical protein [Halomonas anticariensis]EPC02089.1 hypothetical protein L861_04860 [Halomonas anticariensis FP35 = DSM 16096]
MMQSSCNGVVIGTVLTLATSLAHAATWSDTAIGYRFGTQFTEPSNPEEIDKHTLSLTHASGYAYGQNFFNLDILQSNDSDPAHGSDSGATEAYLTYRHQLHYGKLSDEPLAFGPISDIALTGGFDLNTKNTAFAPRKRQVVLGPTLKFDLSRGFLDVSLLYSREWNHCGLDACGAPGNRNSISFDPYYQLSVAWGVPFDVGALPLKFQGFYNYNSEKGKDYFNVETKPEQLMRTSLMLDVGKLAWGEGDNLWAGVGYEYWRNKFGNHDKPGVDTDALTFNLEWHF